MYKIICEVIKVSEPKSIDGKEAHVKWPCKIYKPGDRMTFTTHPATVMVLEETDKVCIQALSGILPLIRPLIMGKAEEWDYIDSCKYFACPDVERPVLFEIKRIPVEPPIHGVTTYEDKQKEIKK